MDRLFRPHGEKDPIQWASLSNMVYKQAYIALDRSAEKTLLNECNTKCVLHMEPGLNRQLETIFDWNSETQQKFRNLP